MSKENKNIHKALGVSFLIIFLSVIFVNAWDSPTADPPGGNVSAPINVSSVRQSKDGPLVLNFLGVRNDARIDGRIHLDGNTDATNYISGESPGIRLRTTDAISFYTGGWNRRMTIHDDGEVNIGGDLTVDGNVYADNIGSTDAGVTVEHDYYGSATAGSTSVTCPSGTVRVGCNAWDRKHRSDVHAQAKPIHSRSCQCHGTSTMTSRVRMDCYAICLEID